MAYQKVADELIELWESVAAAPTAAQREQIARYVSRYTAVELGPISDHIKEKIILMRRQSKESALWLLDLLFLLAELTNEALLRAIYLHARAFLLTIDEKAFGEALEAYGEAAALYQQQNDTLRLALMNVTKIWALGSTGKYEDAFATAQRSEAVLREHKRWRDLGNLYNNMAGIHVVYLGLYEDAVALLEQARVVYEKLGEQGHLPMLASQFNEALLLRHLGHFDASIRLNIDAIEQAAAWDLVISAARGQQTLGTTYFIVGRFNEAIALMEDARASFLQDNRKHDAILVDLSLSTGLLNLGRYRDAVRVTSRVEAFCRESSMPGEAARALYQMGLAHLGLAQLKQAESALETARAAFLRANNEVGSQEARLGLAAVFFRQKKWQTCLATARQCHAFFREKELTPQHVNAALLVGRAALNLGKAALANAVADELYALTALAKIPTLSYQIYHFLGEHAQRNRRLEEAIGFYGHAIEYVEALQGQVISELRPDFLSNKQALYEELVVLFLESNAVSAALNVAERAKSRSLLDMLAQRFSPRIALLNAADQPIANELIDLRSKRDALYREWQSGEHAAVAAQEELFQKIKTLEDEITKAWHTLLVRDANYHRSRSVWQIFVASAQPHLDEKTAVVEYFSCNNRLMLFLITRRALTVHWLDATLDEIKALHEDFWLNLNGVRRTGLSEAFLPNARALLHRAYLKLFAPIGDACTAFESLIFVPHGPLHYFPLHALHTGEAYLVERYAVSYVPGSSFVGMSDAPVPTGQGALVMGYSYANRLPHTSSEATRVAARFGAAPLLETAATKRAFLDAAPTARLIHLATHATFYADNPLFCGVALADDEWLTTLDIFNCELNASLVTLSACDTGRGLIGGGDELLGIMRALLAAGASSTVLSLWPVEDESTEQFMDAFYAALIEHQQNKDAAIQTAQRVLLTSNNPLYHHPYFWAPFFLVGARGKLMQ